jgi:excisionase family DNA binding protein
MQPERLTLTVPEVAEVVGVSRAHAYELIRLGRIPSIRLGRRLVVPRKALDEFLDQACSLEAGRSA